jgi:hypothetical protein
MASHNFWKKRAEAMIEDVLLEDLINTQHRINHYNYEQHIRSTIFF